MSFAFRAALCWLALSLSLFNSLSAQTHSLTSAPSSPPLSHSSPEGDVVAQYFARYAAKDLDGVISLWSRKSPDYAALRQRLQSQFAAEDCSFGAPFISRVRDDGERASLRASVMQAVVDPRSSQRRERRAVHNFDFVREEGRWKVWRSVPAEEDLAEALAAAASEAERARLIAEEKELVTADLARALNSHGDRSAKRGEYPRALASYTLARGVAEQLGDQREVARSLNNLGHTHRVQGDFAPAMECFRAELALHEALGERAGVARALIGVGMVDWLRGDLTQALEQFRKCLTIFEALDDKTAIATVLNNVGNIHRAQGDFEQALECYRKSLKIREETNDTLGILSSLGNIGVVYGSQGDYARALAYYRRSLAMSEARGDKEGIAITLGNIGVLYRKQRDYAQALAYYRKSLAVSEAINDKVGIAGMVNNIGTVHLKQGDHAQALAYYRKSLAMREAVGDKQGVSHTMMAIGVIHNEQGDHAQALAYYQKSMALKEAIGDRNGVANLLFHLGVYHKKQGDHAQALNFAERAAALARQTGDLQLLWGARASAGVAHRALNQFDQARLAFEEAISNVEEMRARVAGSEQAQQRFFEDKLSPYHAMVDMFAARGNPTEALIFAERARARALLDMIHGGRANVVKAMTAEEQDQERKLRTELIALNTQVTRAGRQEKPDEVRLSALKSLREKARLNYEAFQTSLYAAHPELRVQRGEAPIIKAEELPALAPDAGSALLEYVVLDEVTYLFTIVKTTGREGAEVRVHALPIKRTELARQVEAFRGQLAARDLGFRAPAAGLYNLLIKPAAAQLRGRTSLIIAPDDALWDLPFQALMSGANRFLIEDAAVSYAPSLTVLREMNRRRKTQGVVPGGATLLALGNPLLGKETGDGAALKLRDERLAPLPEAEQEVKALRQLYGTARSKIYTGAEAREDRVKSEAGQASILHFAAHGVLNNASPMYSHLALAGGSTSEDGLLEAWELMRLDLKADLAVLSACETARGRVGAGEGMIGLSWAMFIAGVPSIVVSQWKVESAGTRDLMVTFHRALHSQPGNGQATTKTEALRQAELKLLRNPETGHPFYWAGFVLIGDGR
ncbi:MAG TPA: CHAT domain-containing tetratricopeptide repeat protein [Pyrinomonadaceae bacterium]|nr:CHAT domain-containing tetratricopeptide repeat protein [Pyrinomonadaceae bacterium]